MKKNIFIIYLILCYSVSFKKNFTMSYVKSAWTRITNATKKSWNWIRGNQSDENQTLNNENLEQKKMLLENNLPSTKPETIQPENSNQAEKTRSNIAFLKKNTDSLIKRIRKKIIQNKKNPSSENMLTIKTDIKKLKKLYLAQKKLSNNKTQTSLKNDNKNFRSFLTETFSAQSFKNNNNKNFDSSKNTAQNTTQTNSVYSHNKETLHPLHQHNLATTNITDTTNRTQDFTTIQKLQALLLTPHANNIKKKQIKKFHTTKTKQKNRHISSQMLREQQNTPNERIKTHIEIVSLPIKKK